MNIMLATVLAVTNVGDINIYLLPYGSLHRVVYQDDNIIHYDEVFKNRKRALNQYLSFVGSERDESHPDKEKNKKLLQKRIMIWGKQDPPPKLKTGELNNFYDLE